VFAEIIKKKKMIDTILYFLFSYSATDFLYQDELEQYQEEGILTNLNTAFSRDTEQKVYVQHKMFENSKELYQWLQNGAYLYVCGDKEHMAKNVHEALIFIIEKKES